MNTRQEKKVIKTLLEKEIIIYYKVLGTIDRLLDWRGNFVRNIIYWRRREMMFSVWIQKGMSYSVPICRPLILVTDQAWSKIDWGFSDHLALGNDVIVSSFPLRRIVVIFLDRDFDNAKRWSMPTMVMETTKHSEKNVPF